MILVGENSLFRIIERSPEFFKNEATSGERFRDTIQRAGYEGFKTIVLKYMFLHQ
ncbi:hypothetical protein [Methanolobus sp.]|uniref:hypothetical protein n=1 Tax=Methanolobus sp. TaxID=1874737 RepID=UPI0025EDF705|nr:hypothetical protein [Methanolobus sp.]